MNKNVLLKFLQIRINSFPHVAKTHDYVFDNVPTFIFDNVPTDQFADVPTSLSKTGVQIHFAEVPTKFDLMFYSLDED